MKRLFFILLFLPLVGRPQHYNASTGGGEGMVPWVYDGGWTVPIEWHDSLGYIDITDIRALAASTIKILVNTRTGNRTFAFTVTAANGYKVKWGKKESWSGTISNNVLAERTYDTTKCQKYCVIEITKAGAGAITAFTVSRSVAFVANQPQYPAYLWVAANYIGYSPIMYITSLNCTKLEAIWMNSCTGISPTSFIFCYCLRSVTIPPTMLFIGNAFNGCSSLKSITIPYGSISATGVFYNCSALQSIITKALIIGNSNFYNCFSLQSITFLDATATELQTSAFYSCYSIESIIIPPSINNIGAGVFTNCYSLKGVTYTGTITAEADNLDMFKGCEQIDTLNMRGLKTARFSFYGATGKLNKLGASGNLAGDSIPVRINWAGSAFSNLYPPQLNLSYNRLDTTQIQKIFRCLPTITAKTVTVVGCTGAAALSAYAKAIATAKGWTVLN